MTPRTDDPPQALVNAQAVLIPQAGPTPSDDDVLLALVDVERALDIQQQGTVRERLEAARLALTALHAAALLAENPALDDPPVSDDPNEPDPMIPGGGLGLSRYERVLRRAHWSDPVFERVGEVSPEVAEEMGLMP